MGGLGGRQEKKGVFWEEGWEKWGDFRMAPSLPKALGSSWAVKNE